MRLDAPRHPDAKIISFMHQSGGVGKTTTLCVVAEALAINHGKRVLVVDLDPQMDATSILVGTTSREGYIAKEVVDYPGWEEIEELTSPKPNPKPSIRCILMKEDRNEIPFPYPTFIDNTRYLPGKGEVTEERRGCVDLIAGDKQSIVVVNTEFYNAPDKVTNHLYRFLHDDMVWENYDVVLIDNSPTETPMFEASLRASTHVAVPINFDLKNIGNTFGMLGAIEREQTLHRNYDDQLEFLGFIPNMRERDTNLVEVIKDWLFVEHPEIGDYVFPEETWTPRRNCFKEYWLPGVKPRALLDKTQKEFDPVKQAITALGQHIHDAVWGEESRGANGNQKSVLMDEFV